MKNKGVETRLKIHNILFNVFKHGLNLDSSKISKVIKNNDDKDVKFIYNVTLNVMRYQFHCEKIILKYTTKKSKLHEVILLKSAITQIVFLEFKEYAVINSSVEIAKKLNIYHGFINACLKRIAKDKAANEAKSKENQREIFTRYFLKGDTFGSTGFLRIGRALW